MITNASIIRSNPTASRRYFKENESHTGMMKAWMKKTVTKVNEEVERI